MDWWKMHPSRLLADIRQYHLSHEAQGVLLQLCATSAHYDGALSAAALMDEVRPILGRRKRAALLAELAPVLADYLGDVATQAAGYLDKSTKARAAARARWCHASTDADADASAKADANAYANASADAHADAHAEKRREKRSPLPPSGGSLFARFWSAFPKKVGKGQAEKAWQRLRVDEPLLDAMLAALTWQRETPEWRKDGGQFIPHPTTWLNARRWEDERPVDAAPVGTLPAVDWSAI